MATAAARAWASYGDTRELEIDDVKETEFDAQVRRLKLLPSELVNSVALRYWAKLNCHRRYVPEWLLETWGIVVDIEFTAK